MPLITLYLHIVSNNPNVAFACLLGLFVTLPLFGACSVLQVVEWYLVLRSRWIVMLTVRPVGVVFAREVVYS